MLSKLLISHPCTTKTQRERKEGFIGPLRKIISLKGLSENGYCLHENYDKFPPSKIFSGNHYESNSPTKLDARSNCPCLEHSASSDSEDKDIQYDNVPFLKYICPAPGLICRDSTNFEKMSFLKNVSQYERNNSNKSDNTTANPVADSDTYRDCQYSGRVIRVEGDGRCLFRSLVTCKFPELQKALRDEFGCPVRQEEAALETLMADELRQRVVMLMEDNAHFYTQLEKDVINADQPTNQPEKYRRFGERLNAMFIPSTMPGDLELNATTSVLERRILVLDVNLRYIFLYGKDQFPEAPVYAIRYTRLGPDVGHFDAVILDFPVDHLIDRLEIQKIDHLGAERDPSLHEFSALSIRDNSNKGPGNGLVQAKNHDKSCQTQSSVTLVNKDEQHDNNLSPKSPGMEHGCGQKGISATGEEMQDKERNTAWRHKQIMETICTHWKSLISSRPGHGHDINSPNLAENGVTHKVKVDRKCTENYVIEQKQVNHGTRKTFPGKNQLLPKVPDEICFPPPRPRGEKISKQINKKRSSSRKRRLSDCREQNSDHAGGFGVGKKKYKMAPTCKRKLQDCNENHKTGNTRKRKSSVGEENSGKPSGKKINSPSSPAQTAKKRKSTAKDASDSVKETYVPAASLQTLKKRRSINRDGFALDNLTPTSSNPLSNCKSKRSCFICLRTVPTSRRLNVKCFLCSKVAHRLCVQNYMNLKLDNEMDEYFLCQRCVPL